MMVEAGEALRDQQYASTLAPIRAALETPFHSSWKGAAKPEVTLTYFFDYACGYCRQSNPDIERLIAEDKGLRVVYREFPILGPESVAAARVSLAASKAGKFAAYHDALYAAGGRPARRPSPWPPARPASRRAGRRPGAGGRAPRQHDPRQPAGRDRNPAVHSRQPGDQRRGRLRRAQGSGEGGRAKKG